MRIWVDVLFTGAEGYQEFQDLEWSFKTWSDLSRLGVIFQDLEWSFKTVPYFPRMVTKKSIRTYSFLPTRLHDVKKGLVDQDLQDLKWSSTKLFERKPGEVPRPWRMFLGIPRRDLLFKELSEISKPKWGSFKRLLVDSVQEWDR